MMRTPGTGFPDSRSESDEFMLNYGAENAEKVLNPVIQEMFNVIQVSSSEDGQKATDDLVCLGVKYATGRGVKQDDVLALKYFNLAAEQGNACAQYNLGEMYSDGLGVKQDYVLALKYFNLAAQQGNAYAQCNLGEMYYNGHGVKQDYEAALKYYNLAAQQGYVNAQYHLGYMYFNGLGVKQDYVLTLKYFNLAVQQGNADAQSNLGYMYSYGLGVKQDYVLALKYYNLAVEQGNVDAQGNLAYMYLQGNGVEQNYVLALKYYNLAAEQGNAHAQYNLGCMYYYGKGVKQDYVLALKYYNLAVEQGNVDAQGNLGDMYCHGLGVKQDYVLALKYYNLAAEQGHPKAKLKLTQLDEIIESSKETSFENKSAFPIPLSQPDKINPIESEVPNNNEDSRTKPKKGVRKILDLKSSSLLHKRFSKDKEHKKKKSSPSLVSEGTESIIEPFMTESEQSYLSKMSDRSDCSEHSESIKSKILKIKKPSKILWNDTTEKSAKKLWNDTTEKPGKEKKAQKKEKASLKRRSMIISQLSLDTASISQRDISECSSVSKSERSGVETPLSTNTIELLRAQVEAKLAEGHFNELGACFGRDIKNLAQVVLTEDAILKTLKKLKNIDVKDLLKDLDLKNPSIIKYTDKKTTVHAVFRSGHTNPPAFTAHKHNHNLPWYEQKNVRDDFFGFLADCGLDLIKLIQLNQQVKPTKIILTHMDNEANAANSGGEED